MTQDIIDYIESLQQWRNMLKRGERYDDIVRMLRRDHQKIFNEVDDDTLLDFFKTRKRLRKIRAEQRAWTDWVEHFISQAQGAGYIVSKVGNDWKIETGRQVHYLNDAELYLFLIDRQVLQVKILPHSRTVSQ